MRIAEMYFRCGPIEIKVGGFDEGTFEYREKMVPNVCLLSANPELVRTRRLYDAELALTSPDKPEFGLRGVALHEEAA